MRKTNILDLARMKAEGAKIVMITAYDALFARIFDDAGVDVILVGDSLGQVVLGHPDTLNVTMEDMVRHTEAAARGRKRAFLAADMPFLSYQAVRRRRDPQRRAAAPGGGGGGEAGGGTQRRGNDPGDRVGGHPRDGAHRAHTAVGPPDGRLPRAGEDRPAAGTAAGRCRGGAGGGGILGGARGDSRRAGRGDHPDAFDPDDRDRRGSRAATGRCW